MKYLIFFTLLISCSPALDGKLRKTSEARCLVPSVNYYALGPRHVLSTYNAATKFLKYGITRQNY
jgi:hypothetical protein